MKDDETIFELSGGEVSLWAEPGSSVMIRFSESCDPIELGEGEVKEFIEVLQKLLEGIS